MPSPFPGMDPYLEDPVFWPGVHHFLISAFAELLNRQIRPNYIADIEERVYLTPDDDPSTERPRIPDVWIERSIGTGAKPIKLNGNSASAIVAEPLLLTTIQREETHEPRIEIRTTRTRTLVTVIELLSPSNKQFGSEGHKSFRDKRREITSSKAHWVEIDLLRDGSSLPLRKRLKPHEYFVHISPVELRPKGRVWPLRLVDRLPTIGIPLRAPDADAPLDLQHALELVYERGSYDLKLKYGDDPTPPLSPDLAKWANKLLKQKKLRKA